MKNVRGFVLAAACLLFSSPLMARSLGVACELSQDGNWGTSVYQTYEFFDEDDFYAAAQTVIRGHDSVNGTDLYLWYFAGWATADDPDAVWGSEDFPLSVQTGGTDYGYLWAYDDTGHTADNTSPTMTYGKTQCYIEVNINTGGYYTGTWATGWYACGTCASLTAWPNQGFAFDGWTGTFASNSQTLFFCMIGDVYLWANFSSMPPLPQPPPPQECNAGTDGTCESPLILNLGSGAYELTGAGDPVSFDLDADGVLERVTWTARSAPMAFLALDRNDNGVIDDGSELFGNHTPLPSGGVAANGFAALAAFDSNGDGVIDARDEVWRKLLLWVDSNHDGICQPEEVSRLADSGITALSYTAHWTGRRDGAGNVFRYEAMYYQGRIARPYYDVYFVRLP